EIRLGILPSKAPQNVFQSLFINEIQVDLLDDSITTFYLPKFYKILHSIRNDRKLNTIKKIFKSKYLKFKYRFLLHSQFRKNFKCTSKIVDLINLYVPKPPVVKLIRFLELMSQGDTYLTYSLSASALIDLENPFIILDCFYDGELKGFPQKLVSVFFNIQVPEGDGNSGLSKSAKVSDELLFFSQVEEPLLVFAPKIVKPQELITMFFMNEETIGLHTLSMVFLPKYDWKFDEDFLLSFQPIAKPQVGNYSFYVQVILLPEDHNDRSLPQDVSEVYECHFEECLVFRFRCGTHSSVHHPQDLLGRVLKFQFSFSDGESQARWSIIVIPKLSTEVVDELQEYNTFILDNFKKMEINGRSILEQKFYHGPENLSTSYLDIIYASPKFSLKFERAPKKNQAPRRISFFFAPRVDDDQLILQSTASSEDFGTYIWKGLFQDINTCEDLHRKELSMIISHPENREFYFSSINMQFHVPSLMLRKNCILLTKEEFKELHEMKRNLIPLENSNKVKFLIRQLIMHNNSMSDIDETFGRRQLPLIVVFFKQDFRWLMSNASMLVYIEAKPSSEIPEYVRKG
ncbi:hypothetical protein HMI55_000877, partial [Coelomomyces lativittatus]